MLQPQTLEKVRCEAGPPLRLMIQVTLVKNKVTG